MKRKPQNSAAFFENNSWYHRTKILQDDGSIKYSKKGGFATSEEADKSYRRHEDEFKKAYRAYHLAHQINTEVTLKDYLIYWFEEIFSQRIETTIQEILGIGRSKTYTFLDEAYRNQKPFRVLKVGKLFRVPKQSFDDWLDGIS